MTHNIVMIVEYDGTHFNGFQKQAQGNTVQSTLETAIEKFSGVSHTLQYAGRTDSGVHATYQVINFHTHITRTLHSWTHGVNHYLPSTVVIKQSYIAPNEFHARNSATSRTYQYDLYVGLTRSAIMRNRVGWCKQNLDKTLVEKAMKTLIGVHDFKSFQAAGCMSSTSVRHMFDAQLSVFNNIWSFIFTANAFLYHMIRNIMGLLIYIGCGKLSLSDAEHLIALKDRKYMPPTYEPQGLCLVKVTYPNHFGLSHAT
jgi:tRNA pseudouridine38-40 synthase